MSFYFNAVIFINPKKEGSKMQTSKKYIAAVLGGSGSVGKHVLKSLLADTDCNKVILLSRRELDDIKALDPDRVQVQVCNPLDDLSNANLSGAKVAFCTLGHGSSRKASKEDLMQVDATIPGNFARVCKEAGVTHYCLMTAIGADEKAKWSFITKSSAGGGWYNHVKGVAERLSIEAGMSFTYIAQPGALLGSPHTPKFLEWIPNRMIPKTMSSAHVEDIGKGMVKTTINAFQHNKEGVVRIAGGVQISKGE